MSSTEKQHFVNLSQNYKKKKLMTAVVWKIIFCFCSKLVCEIMTGIAVLGVFLSLLLHVVDQVKVLHFFFDQVKIWHFSSLFTNLNTHKTKLYYCNIYKAYKNIGCLHRVSKHHNEDLFNQSPHDKEWLINPPHQFYKGWLQPNRATGHCITYCSNHIKCKGTSKNWLK